jgi:1,4-alpha-glucan branching enzyme
MAKKKNIQQQSLKNTSIKKESKVAAVNIQISHQTNKYEEKVFINTKRPVWNYSLFTEEDIRNFKNGTHYSLYNFLGNKQIEVLNKQGTYFAVWAPNASYVSVVGNFNNWDTAAHLLIARLDGSGIWEGFIPTFKEGEAYKYHIVGYKAKRKLDKGDPFANLLGKKT